MPVLSDAALRALLDDDSAGGDLTSDTLGLRRWQGRFEFRARQPMRACAVEEVVRVCLIAGLGVSIGCRSGDDLSPGQLILQARGSASALHLAWKPAQVLIEWACGIATAAAEIVAAAVGTPVACTRKNVPGTKALSIKAVRSGGATMHRLGLSETLLLFAEHRCFLDQSPPATIQRLRRAEPEKKIVVEVDDLRQAVIWGSAGADILQLEKFTPAAVAECRRLARTNFPWSMLAAAGGIRADNAAAYVAAGADLLVTSAPYTAPPRDVAVSFLPC